MACHGRTCMGRGHDLPTFLGSHAGAVVLSATRAGRTHHDALDVQHRPGRGAALPGGPRRHCRVLLPRAAVRRRAHRFGASRSSRFAPLADKRLRYTASAPKHGTTLWRKGPDRRSVPEVGRSWIATGGVRSPVTAGRGRIVEACSVLATPGRNWSTRSLG